MSFGSNMAKLRNERGIYQKELATSLKISIATVSNYEKDRHFPDAAMLCKIADFFDVSVDYLLGRTDFRYNVETLHRPFTDKYTISDLVNTSLEFSPEHKRSLTEYVQMIKIAEQNTSSGE